MPRARVLIVDDDRAFCTKLTGALEGLFHVDVCHSEDDFRDLFAVGRFDLLIMDMRLREDREGLDLLKDALEQDTTQAAIVMTAYADTASYADAIASGAMTYLDKRDFSPALIARTVEAIVQQGMLQRRLAAAERRLEIAEPQEMIGISAGIKEVGERVRRAAEDGDAPVLIYGEPGSGCELAARTIHRLSRRRGEAPFVLVPCRRVETGHPVVSLFGSSQALNGSRGGDSKGWIDEARGGVLYADSLSGLAPDAVSVLARLIETDRFTRAGGSEPLEVDVQVVVSVRTEIALDDALTKVRAAVVENGGIEIVIPALRERREDIPLLAQYTLQRFYRLGRSQARSFRGKALSMLETRDWPGNIRELKSAIEYAAVRADASGDREIGPEHLPLTAMESPSLPRASSSTMDYRVHLARAELGLVESAIERFETTTKSTLAERLHYNDRYALPRRIRKLLAHYPELKTEFPQTANLFGRDRRGKRRRAL